MTYLEKITFLTGNFLQVSQFVIKNAYRVICLTEGKNKETHYLSKSPEYIEGYESLARSYIIKNESLSGQQLITFFENHVGLSKKDFNDLVKILKKRDYLVSYFFIENSPKMAREEVAVYESLIKELNEYIELANKLNVSLAKACDRLYDMF